MASYCDDADVVPFLPSGGLPNAALAATAVASSNEIVCEGHGLADDTEVRFRVETGGALPGGLAAATTYYAIVVSASRFKVAATAGGAAIDLTTAGNDFVFTKTLPYAAWREWGARQIDGMLPVHVTPIVAEDDGSYPAVVVTANAELAAAYGLSVTGGAEIDLGAKIDAIRIRLKDWVRGLPLRGEAKSTQSPVNLAIIGTASTDTRGWVSTASDGSEVIP